MPRIGLFELFFIITNAEWICKGVLKNYHNKAKELFDGDYQKCHGVDRML